MFTVMKLFDRKHDRSDFTCNIQHRRTEAKVTTFVYNDPF